MKIKYCVLCRRQVSPTRSSFSIFCFLFLGLLPYLIWYLIKPKNRCPICKSSHLRKLKKNKTIGYINRVNFNE